MARSTILTKTCTKSGKVFKGTFDALTEHFYRDKSQKDGLSPWSKDAERAYNKAYRAGLTKAKVDLVRNIDNDDARATFEKVMRPERVKRTRRDATRTAPAKATTKARKSARNAKAKS